MRHRHPATKEHLELLGERVVKLRRAMELLLAGNLPGLADGADDLRHLRREEGGLFSARSSGTPTLAHKGRECTRSQHHVLPTRSFVHSIMGD